MFWWVLHWIVPSFLTHHTMHHYLPPWSIFPSFSRSGSHCWLAPVGSSFRVQLTIIVDQGCLHRGTWQARPNSRPRLKVILKLSYLVISNFVKTSFKVWGTSTLQLLQSQQRVQLSAVWLLWGLGLLWKQKQLCTTHFHNLMEVWPLIMNGLL